MWSFLAKYLVAPLAVWLAIVVAKATGHLAWSWWVVLTPMALFMLGWVAFLWFLLTHMDIG